MVTLRLSCCGNAGPICSKEEFHSVVELEGEQSDVEKGDIVVGVKISCADHMLVGMCVRGWRRSCGRPRS